MPETWQCDSEARDEGVAKEQHKCHPVGGIQDRYLLTGRTVNRRTFRIVKEME
jgi:hypothetical protein